MYPGVRVKTHPDQAAFIMASTGETVTYAELERRTNRIAHYLQDAGLKRLDHYSIFMENHPRYIECCGAGERSGLYYTCINSYLQPDELAYILTNSQSKVLFTSKAKLPVALEALKDAPNVERVLVVDGPGDGGKVESLDEAVGRFPETRIADEKLGGAMLYSSGTTGRPKGIIRPLMDIAPTDAAALFGFLSNLWRYREGMIYLSPAPLYHSAPQAAVGLTLRNGGTAVIMEHFDPEQYLANVERYHVTHSQLVPTMFSRMLKLDDATRARYDLSSLEVVVHAAAPCPIPVKRQMIEWWGPKILEYYGATEGLGFAACDSEEWLAHPGTVGKIVMGDLTILDEEGNPAPKGEPGTLWFKSGAQFEYFHDPEKTKEARHGDMTTVGDVGYLDDDGYLFLTDRRTFMIISGGVNIYPQECENLLITHPKVADAAVFGVPNEDLGEEVKAVVQPMPHVEAGPALEAELIGFCREHLAHMKCPKTIDFEAELPRLPTGKLYKRVLRDRYWADRKTRIV